MATPYEIEFNCGIFKEETGQIFAGYCHEIVHNQLVKVQQKLRGGNGLEQRFRNALLEKTWDEDTCSEIAESASRVFPDLETVYNEVASLYVSQRYPDKSLSLRSLPSVTKFLQGLFQHVITKQPVTTMKFFESMLEATIAVQTAARAALNQVCRQAKLVPLKTKTPSVFSSRSGAASFVPKEPNGTVLQTDKEAEHYDSGVTQVLRSQHKKRRGKSRRSYVESKAPSSYAGSRMSTVQETEVSTRLSSNVDQRVPTTVSRNESRVPTQVPTRVEGSRVPTQVPTGSRVPTQVPTGSRVPTQVPTRVEGSRVATQVPARVEGSRVATRIEGSRVDRDPTQVSSHSRVEKSATRVEDGRSQVARSRVGRS